MYKELNLEIKQPQIVLDRVIYSNPPSIWERSSVNLEMFIARPEYSKHGRDKVPVIVWMEGGAWTNYTPMYRLADLSYIVKAGYALVSVGYTTTRDAIWPQYLIDVKNAIRYLRAHDELNLDTDHIIVGGESAGAHLALMAGLTIGEDKYLGTEYKELNDSVNGVIGFYTPADLTLWEQHPEFVYNGLCGEDDKFTERLHDFNPFNHIHKGIPPILLLHGNQDPLVDYHSALSFYEKSKDYTDVDMYLIDGARHADVHFSQEEVQKIVLDFIKKNIIK